MNVLIVEDEVEAGDRLQQMLKSNGISVSGIARTHSEALQMISTLPVDVAVIDIFLSGIPEGVNFAETLCAVPAISRPFVFLTSSKDRVVFERAKLTRPFAFLMKPFNELELLYALEMAVARFYDKEDDLEADSAIAADKALFVKSRGVLKKIYPEEILFVQVEDRYCTLRLAEERYVIQNSLKRVQEMLDPDVFLQTHRNFLVNRHKITGIIPGEDTILVEGGHSVPLSETYKNIVQKMRIL